MTILSQLEALALDFSVVQDPSPGPLEFIVRLQPPDGRILTVDDLVTTTQIVPGTLDLNWRTKDVRFGDRDITHVNTVGGMPVNNLLAIGVGAVTDGGPVPPGVPGVPGVLGALGGTLPIPIDVTNAVQKPVTVRVRWRVRDGGGSIITDVTWTVGAQAGNGGEINPPVADALAAVDLVFSAVFVELTSNPSPTAERSIQASVRLEAAGNITDWIELPLLQVTIPAVPVPTMAIFHQHKSFQGNTLLVVPASSPLDKGTVDAALTTLKDALTPLQAALAVLNLIVGSLDGIRNTLSTARVTFRKSDSIGNLNDIDLESGFFNDTEAEDELSSLVMLGPPRRQIQGFNARNLSTSEGEIDITIGAELIASIDDLHSASPVSDPPGRVSVPIAPHGTRWDGLDPWHDITGFGDELSSLRFGWSS